MIEQVVAAGAIHVGEHDEVQWLGLTFNVDTILATAVAAVIVIGLAFFLRAKVTSTDVPGGVQLFFEAITIQMRNQVESAIGIKVAPFVLPLAVALFVFILVANWLSVLPVQYSSGGETHELLKPPAADINFVLALALFVFLCYHAAGVWRRGFFGHWVKLLKGHVAFMAPINLVEEIAKPISLSLRLFGNLFAGGILCHADRRFDSHAVHVGTQCHLEAVRPVRRLDPSVHLRSSDDPVLQSVDGAGPRRRPRRRR